ncbi:MAG TPA: AprI/Inh family metalloprotease inhibitor [Caulobacteraceae bacterium]
MRPLAIAAGLAATVFLAGQAAGADHEAGVPLTPSEAAGAWSLEQNGQTICTLDLGRQRAHEGFSVRSRGTCGDALQAPPVAWAPTADGMKLVGADGQTVVAFGRWSNSLFVTSPGSGVSLQLRRGR